MKKKKTYGKWTLIPWDGNPELGFMCWRKSFGYGHVSIGVGAFQAVVFSYGANSDSSFSSTRWNYDKPTISEEDAMKGVDETGGRCLPERLHQKPIDWPNK